MIFWQREIEKGGDCKVDKYNSGFSWDSLHWLYLKRKGWSGACPWRTRGCVFVITTTGMKNMPIKNLLIRSHYRLPITRIGNKSSNLFTIFSLSSRNLHVKTNFPHHSLCFFHFHVYSLHHHMSLIKSEIPSYDIFWSFRFNLQHILTFHTSKITN